MRGAFTAAVLTELEKNIGRPAARHFDLMVGTSTGALLAIGLAHGLAAAEIENLYAAHGQSIFPSGGVARLFRRGRSLFLPKHSQVPLRMALRHLFGEATMGDLSTRTVVPIFSGQKGEACTFKTPHHERCWQDRYLPLVDVAVAAAAAPTYFGAVGMPTREDERYIDGGVWANTPVMIGLTEALAYCGATLDEISMLSIGTTASMINTAKLSNAGKLGWAWNILDPIFAGQATGALHQAKLLLGDVRFLRIDYGVARSVDLDDARASSLAELRAVGHGIARANDLVNRVEAQFLNGVAAVPFTSFKSPRELTELRDRRQVDP